MEPIKDNNLRVENWTPVDPKIMLSTSKFEGQTQHQIIIFSQELGLTFRILVQKIIDDERTLVLSRELPPILLVGGIGKNDPMLVNPRMIVEHNLSELEVFEVAKIHGVPYREIKELVEIVMNSYPNPDEFNKAFDDGTLMNQIFKYLKDQLGPVSQPGTSEEQLGEVIVKILKDKQRIIPEIVQSFAEKWNLNLD